MPIPVLSGITHQNELRKSKRQEIHDHVRDEWVRTRESRNGEIRDAAVKNYKLYQRANDDVIKAERQRNFMNPGNKGSLLRAPVVFWGVETLLPRLVTVPPQFTVTGKTMESHKFARAKQARLNYYAKQSHFHQRLIAITRQTLILGNSPAKVTFEPDRSQPEMQFIPWFDFFFSPEARTVRHADWVFHRTFYSELGAGWLDGFRDHKNRKTFKDVMDIPLARREVSDDTYTERRTEIQGERDEQEIPVRCIIEAWSKYGHYVALGGNNGDLLLAAKQSPYIMPNGTPYRPFNWFGFHQDIDSPYGQGVGEIIGDHQIEMEVLRNGQMEQIRGNLYAPVIALDNIDADELEAALSVPNGIAFADSMKVSRVSDVAMRMPPGQASTDYERARDDIRTEVQMVLGISDSISGVQLPGGSQDNTATGATIRQQESNKRIQLLGIDLELELQHTAKMFDAHDRQFGGEVYVRTSDLGLSGGLTPEGMTISDAMVKIGEEVNEAEYDYQVEVSAGSLQKQDEMHVHQAYQKFVANMSHPNMAPYINWREAATMYANLTGHDGLILEPQEVVDLQQQAQMSQAAQQLGPASPLGNGPGAQQAEMGAGAPPTPPGPPAPPNVTGPTER